MPALFLKPPPATGGSPVPRKTASLHMAIVRAVFRLFSCVTYSPFILTIFFFISARFFISFLYDFFHPYVADKRNDPAQSSTKILSKKLQWRAFAVSFSCVICSNRLSKYIVNDFLFYKTKITRINVLNAYKI